MKKIMLSAAILLTLSISCKKEEIQSGPVKVSEVPADIPIIRECYEGVTKKDTFRMSIQMKGDAFVDGKLSYLFFEKDKNEGSLKGIMIGDTLFADYTFISEGMTSVREVVFLKKGKIFIEGYGDVSERPGNKVVFKDKKKLYFDSKNILAKTDCK